MKEVKAGIQADTITSVVEFLAEIKKRPGLFLRKEYLSCLSSFLDGWALRHPKEITDTEVMGGFQQWIIQRFDVKTNHDWSDVILFYSKGEHKALALFFELFDQYLVEKHPDLEG